MPAATRTPRKARPARKAADVKPDQVKADADAILDGLVNGTPVEAVAFLERLAAERARAQQLGLFKLWSINNRCYLEGQVRRRKANVKNLYAGADQWKTLKREVRPDELEKGFSIYAPRMRTVEEKLPGQKQAEKVRRCIGFTITHVYDWTQTVSTVEGYIEPDWEVPVAAGDLTTLRQLAAAAPVPVTFADLGSTNAHAKFDGERITVDSSVPVGNQIFALATQLAHRHLGHAADVDAPLVLAPHRVTEELATAHDVVRAEATLVGWTVARALGLDDDTDGALTKLAQAYLHSWTKTNADGTTMELAGTKSRRKLLRARMDDTLGAADAILGDYCTAGRDAAAAEDVA